MALENVALAGVFGRAGIQSGFYSSNPTCEIGDHGQRYRLSERISCRSKNTRAGARPGSFGDGVYEVVPVYSRHPFRLAEHLKRLQNSLDGIRLANPLPRRRWTGLTHELVKPTRATTSRSISRSRAARPSARTNFRLNVKPTVFMMSNPLVTPRATKLKKACPASPATDFRWLKCDLKSISCSATAC